MLPFRNRPDDYEESIDERNNQNGNLKPRRVIDLAQLIIV